MLKKSVSNLPQNPGVYLFKNQKGDIIYIGKAKNLKNRVSSYFTSKPNESPKTQFLVKNISDIDHIIVNNEIEALLLENKLIKKHKPKYNINLKDDKTFAYIKITNEKIPKITSTRTITSNGTYFGPYTDGYLRREIEKLVVQIFKIATKKTYSSKSKLNYQIGLSPAPREEDINIKEYNKNVELAKEFLKGNTNKILKKLKNDMKESSKNLQFEIAKEKKRQIEAIEHLNQKQSVDLIKKHNQDVLVIETNNKDKSLIQLFKISKGVISNKKNYTFNYYEKDLLEEFMKMYYSKNPIPKEIIVSQNPSQTKEDKDLLEQYLSKQKKSKVSITIPKRGEKLQLIKISQKNAKINFGSDDISIQLKNKLKLNQTPKIIECFDMSNLGFEHLVGAMTRWQDAKEDTKNFRRYKIKSFKNKNDDYAAMKEVIYRRYKRLKDNKQELPNLIIIDGGKGQLNSSIQSLKELNLKIPIIGIAKQEEEIFLPGKKDPLTFNKNSEMMLFLRKIRDRTHNYVINYNKKRRDIKLKEEFKNL
jgi:excinuclease ABC subunit C